MIVRVDRVGTKVLELLGFFRDVAVLGYGALKSPFVARAHGARVVVEVILAQIRFTGAQGVPLAAFAAVAIGTLILIEAVSFIPDAELVPRIVARVTIGDVTPLLAALIVIGRSGTAISVELANMKLNGEVDALVSMGLPIEHFVVLPRLVAAVVSFVGLICIGHAAALVGGFLVASSVVRLPFTLATLIEAVSVGDLATSFVKGVLLGAAISVICIREGLSVRVSAREVPQAATRAVVRAMTLSLVLNSFVSIYG